MLVWNETDVLTCLEVMPEIDTDAISRKYTIRKDGLGLEVLIYPYDGDVFFELHREGIARPVFFMKLLECPGIRYIREHCNEYLEFAPAKCFGSRYDSESVVPFGVRVSVNPSIQVEIF